MGELIRAGEVKDQAELARLGHVSRARLSQITRLLSLAPDIQELLLWLSATQAGNQALTERRLRSIAAIDNWNAQRKMWLELGHPSLALDHG